MCSPLVICPSSVWACNFTVLPVTVQAGHNHQPGHTSDADKYKAQANEAFKAGDFDGAITGYSGAIQADPANPVYFSNRAMAYLKVSSLSRLTQFLDMPSVGHGRVQIPCKV